MARIVCYLSDTVKAELTKRAEQHGQSVSKLANTLLEQALENEHSTERYQRKTEYMLAQILGSVYDASTTSANAESVKSLIRKIDDKVGSDMADSSFNA